MSYLALPGKVVLLLPASVQGDQEVCTSVPVLDGEAGIGHLLPGSYLKASVTLPNKTWGNHLALAAERANGKSKRTGGIRKPNGTLNRFGDGHVGVRKGGWISIVLATGTSDNEVCSYSAVLGLAGACQVISRVT